MSGLLRRTRDAAAAVLGWLVLAPVYLVVFSAGRAWLGLTRRDPLARRVPPPAATFWVRRGPFGPPDRPYT